ncbi:MAG TPA: tetratricopeptide repeat protein [Phycisphaerae bacterium]|jgi:tetratricopeptide (TPR) repeat protein|nr:tetratricopeptide repeat protein [Phycisphaerae bacterium]HOJ54638.1 tetratricopeptide repeat protein [Phycisphaerae bacterium]HOL27264.1 tetratricopeptide repeat protein [Phycisphaerae bacterium]HPP21064.1 tetratricopeptide repeat protein [Phycisphaerae bacterium]HPU33026.1 tetratricopeptide repeat protein [Phycisphaerae bacterium]
MWSSRSARVLVKVFILVLLCGLLLGGGVSLHKYRRHATAQKALATGKAAYEARQYTRAAVELGRYLAVDQRNTEILLLYADAQMRRRPRPQGSVQQAVNAWELVLRQQPGHQTAAMRLLATYTALDSRIDVERVARAWLNTPGIDAAARAEARGHLLSALLAQQKLDDADRVVQEWLTQAPGDPAALLARAEVLVARKRPYEAVTVLTSAAEAHPGDAAVVSRLASLLVEHRKDQQAAEKLLDDLVEKSPRSPEARLARASFYLGLVGAAYSPVPEHRRRIIQDLEAADDLAAEDFDVLVNLATVFSQVGLTGRAMAVLGRAEKAAPTVTSIYVQQGQLALEANDTAAALAVVDRALAAPLGEQRMDVLPVVAEICVSARQFERARKAIEDLRGGNVEPELLLYLEGVLELAEGKIPAGVVKLQEVVRREPEYARAYLRLGRALVEMGDLRRAVRALGTYVRLERRAGRVNAAATVQLELARLCGRLERWDEALEVVRNLELRLADPDLAYRARLARVEFESQVARRQGPEGMATLQKHQAELETLAGQVDQPLPLRILQARLAGWQGDLNRAETLLNVAPASAEGRQAIAVARIELYADAGRFEKAIAACQSALESADRSAVPDLRSRLAGLHAAAGDLATARRILQETVAESSGSARSAARLELARLLIRHQRPEEAREVLGQTIQDDPQCLAACLLLLQLSPAGEGRLSRQKVVDAIRRIEGEKGLNTQYWQAVVWLEGQDWADHRKDIESLLSECMSEASDWDAPVIALGALYEKAGETERALAAYERFLTVNNRNMVVAHRLLALAQEAQRWQVMERVLRVLPADEPSLGTYHLSLALAQGQTDRADQLLEKRIKANPEDFAARLQLCALKLQSDQIDEAERLLGEAMRIAPDAPQVLSARVQLHLHKKEHDAALRLCDEAIARQSHPDLLQLRSWVHEARGNLDRAAGDLRAMAAMEGATENGFLALGRLYARQQQVARALESWREGLAKVPQSYALRRDLAGMLLADPAKPEAAEGLRMVNDLLAEQPGDLTLLLMRADYLARTRPQEAEKEFETIVQMHPGSPEAWRGYAQAAVSRGQLDRARERVEKGLDANPRDVELLLLRCQLLITRSPELAAVSARQALEIQPGHEKAAVLLADALASSGNAKRAIQVLEKTLSQPDAGPLTAVRLALAHLHIQAGDFKAAETLIQQAQRQMPESEAVVRARILWHQAQGHWEALADLANDYQGRRPSDAQALRLIARALAGSGRTTEQQKSIQLFRQLAEEHPEDATLRHELGAAYFAAGDLEQTRAAYQQALTMDPANPVILNNWTWIVCEGMNDPAAALEWGRKALSIAPDNPHVLDTWGVLQYRLGRYEESREALQKCLAQEGLSRSTRASASFHLGRTLAKLESQESRKQLEKLLRSRDLERQLSEADRQEARSLLTQLTTTLQP